MSAPSPMPEPAPVRADQDAELDDLLATLREGPGCDCDDCVGGCHVRQLEALAAHTIATLRAERDQLAASLAAAVIEISVLAQAKGESEGRLRASEMAGVVEGWREQNERLAAELREAREERDRLRGLADAAAFHFFCCNDGIHRDDDCGQLVPAMADLAKAIDFRNDPGTDEEIAAVPVSSAVDKSALTPDPHQAAGSASGKEETDA